MSDILKSITEDMNALNQSGVVSEITMRKFKRECLTDVRRLTPTEIKRIRTSQHVSQSVFAAYLNMSKESVQKWERGVKSPEGAALKMLTLVKEKGLEAIA